MRIFLQHSTPVAADLTIGSPPQGPYWEQNDPTWRQRLLDGQLVPFDVDKSWFSRETPLYQHWQAPTC
jgi:hypothetical protein